MHYFLQASHLINNEEEAALAMHVTNTLTQSLLRYRLGGGASQTWRKEIGTRNIKNNVRIRIYFLVLISGYTCAFQMNVSFVQNEVINYLNQKKKRFFISKI